MTHQILKTAYFRYCSVNIEIQCISNAYKRCSILWNVTFCDFLNLFSIYFLKCISCSKKTILLLLKGIIFKLVFIKLFVNVFFISILR